MPERRSVGGMRDPLHLVYGTTWSTLLLCGSSSTAAQSQTFRSMGERGLPPLHCDQAVTSMRYLSLYLTKLGTTSSHDFRRRALRNSRTSTGRPLCGTDPATALGHWTVTGLKAATGRALL
jgi:hypothetical protein